MKIPEKLEYLKDFNILKLHLEYKKNGVLALNTFSGTITKAGSCGYDKRGTVFKNLFSMLGFDVSKICYTKFDLFDGTIEDTNDFLKQNNIDYKVVYRSEVTDRISFIELSKINWVFK
jgi:hypothetical protein